ncbi:MAG: TetR/AcrR family transcriptional regulator [Clostridia bacterium]|nr:TetR/AcrR family transcriptional regulator [Clostridia bacterium]
MATPFTPAECEQITLRLREAARSHAVREGMIKTTVDDLASDASISKGAFYRFYASKELLFLDMLDHWQREIFAKGQQVLDSNAQLPMQERTALAFRTVLQSILKNPLEKFFVRDLPVLLRRVPRAVLEKHYRSEEQFLVDVINAIGVKLCVPPQTAAAAIHILALSIGHADQVGPSYADGLNALVDAACHRLIASE